MTEPLLPDLPASIRIDNRKTRPVTTYTVPEKSRAEVGITSLGLVELTHDEEMRVMQSIRGATTSAAIKVQSDLAHAALQEIDGKPLPAIGEGRDAAIKSLGPKARTLLMRAFADLHTVAKEVEADFLKGKTTSV
jgi:hypothetical protein